MRRHARTARAADRPPGRAALATALRPRPSPGSAQQVATDRPQPASARAQPYRVLPSVRLKAKPRPGCCPSRGYHLTGRFGQSSGLWASTHTGLDFAAPEGTEIRSIGPGVVVSTASTDGAYGNKTVVRLDDGTVLWYCHQSEFGVDVGPAAVARRPVGYVGSTGNTTGPHLHLEVHPHGGGPIDPEAWLPEHHLHP